MRMSLPHVHISLNSCLFLSEQWGLHIISSLFYSRTVFLRRHRATQLFTWSFKVTFVYTAAVLARDGSLRLTALNAVVLCLLTPLCGPVIQTQMTTDTAASRVTVKVFTKVRSEWQSTLAIVLGTGTLMVKLAGTPCPV